MNCFRKSVIAAGVDLGILDAAYATILYKSITAPATMDVVKDVANYMGWKLYTSGRVDISELSSEVIVGYSLVDYIPSQLVFGDEVNSHVEYGPIENFWDYTILFIIDPNPQVQIIKV